MKKFLQALLFLCIIFCVVALGFGYYIYTQLQPVDPTATDQITFVIPKGQATSIIANRLQEENIIKNALIFRALARIEGFQSKIQSGSFELSPALSPSQVGASLTTGTEDIWVTILEGWRVEEIAESLESQELPLFDADEFISLAKSDEGRMYPDSYLIPREFTAQQVYSLLLNTFESKVLEGLADEIEASGRDFDEVLVMASIVEREGRGLEQMRHVASILWNRVDIGMPIQADATLQYVEGYNKVQKSWWSPPNVATKSVDSPYNTYVNPGLPPRPIANPSSDAILATLDPIESDDLFYIHDRTGQMHYAETLDGHNANINRYLR